MVGENFETFDAQIKKNAFFNGKIENVPFYSHRHTKLSGDLYYRIPFSSVYTITWHLVLSPAERGDYRVFHILAKFSPPELLLEVGQFYCIFKLQKLCCCTPFRGFHPQYISYLLTYALFNSYHMHALTL